MPAAKIYILVGPVGIFQASQRITFAKIKSCIGQHNLTKSTEPGHLTAAKSESGFRFTKLVFSDWHGVNLPARLKFDDVMVTVTVTVTWAA